MLAGEGYENALENHQSVLWLKDLVQIPAFSTEAECIVDIIELFVNEDKNVGREVAQSWHLWRWEAGCG